MNYSRFEDLPVWQEATKLAEAVYSMNVRRNWNLSLREELERAAPYFPTKITVGSSLM